MSDFVERVAYDAALKDREQFLGRLTSVCTAMRKIKTCDFDKAVDAVKGTPDEKLVSDVCWVLAGEVRFSARLRQLLDHFLAEAGVDPESFDPWDDYGV